MAEVLLERDGSVIPDRARIPCRWEEHFKGFLDHAAPLNTAFLAADAPAPEHYTCRVDPPNLEGVCMTIRQLRNNKAPGEDSTAADVPWPPGPVASSGDHQSTVARGCSKYLERGHSSSYFVEGGHAHALLLWKY